MFLKHEGHILDSSMAKTLYIFVGNKHGVSPLLFQRKRDTASAISLRKDFISKVYWDRRETTVPLYLLITYKEPLFA
ncbi:hypothetical protein CRM71_12995 [Prevotella jejuni]|nr:hypothetical protein CRM71_12995 [Prevotella jejuni]